MPARLDRLAAAPAVAAVVAIIDPRSLSGHDQVALLRSQQRPVWFLTARLYATMAALVESIAHNDDHLEPSAEEAAAAEISAALRLTRRAADTELCDALDLDRRLPEVADALERGDIDVRRVRTLLRGTSHLSVGVAQSALATVLDEAAELTTGQLAARLRGVCIEVDPDEAERRYEFTADGRCIVAEPEVDGTASF